MIIEFAEFHMKLNSISPLFRVRYTRSSLGYGFKVYRGTQLINSGLQCIPPSPTTAMACIPDDKWNPPVDEKVIN
jgi:hypothetical protein